MTRLGRSVAVLLAVAALLVPGVARAQLEGGSHTTRAELRSLLEQYELAARSPGYSEVLRSEAEARAATVRERLELGDYRAGDRVLLRVEGHEELTDTFVVAEGRIVRLPGLGDLRLEGVLRSELQAAFDSTLQQYLRDPRGTARSLIRVSVTGGVARPGYHVLDAQSLLSEALMAAGGPTADAQLREILVRRGDLHLLTGGAAARGMAEGYSLDQLGLASGDEIHVPQRGGLGERLRSVLLVIPSLLGLAAFLL